MTGMHLHVLAMVAVASERAAASVAQVRSLAGMNASMSDETALPRERLAAVGA